MSSVAVVDSGVANLASVESALLALGAEPLVTRDPVVVGRASHVVLPGVGRFEAGILSLREAGLDRVIRESHEAGKPLLAICLGMQLMGAGSDESPGVQGLGIFPGRFRRLPDTVRVPHLGWNRVTPERSAELPHGMAAFANSFGLMEPPEGWQVAWTFHGELFVSALKRGRTLAVQFHPELSGDFGMGLLEGWLSERAFRTAHGMTGAQAQLTLRIIPCLDVRDGRIVKGVRFQNLRDAGDPAEQAGTYEAQGADEVILLDVAASPEGRGTQLDTVGAVRRRIHIPLTVGGGVRTEADARDLLAAGADKVSVNTAAVQSPDLLRRLAGRFGSQCVVLAIDARRKGEGWEVLVKGGREAVTLDAVEWAREGAGLGAGEILLTSWDRDGTREGCDLELLQAVAREVRIPVIASGGVGTAEDAVEAFRGGASAVLAASIFHDAEVTVGEVKEFLATEGVAVRR